MIDYNNRVEIRLFDTSKRKPSKYVIHISAEEVRDIVSSAYHNASILIGCKQGVTFVVAGTPEEVLNKLNKKTISKGEI